MKKRQVRRKIVDVTRRVVYGVPDAVQAVLSKVGQKINTAFIERVNRTLRQLRASCCGHMYPDWGDERKAWRRRKRVCVGGWCW